MLNKIALKNAVKHKWSSIVILSVFAVSSFVIYWAFGFSNTFTETISESAMKINGHLSYQTDYISKEKSEEIFKMEGIEKVVLERRVGVASVSKKESGMLMICEMSDKYRETVGKIKLDFGEMPEKTDEILISNEYDDTKLRPGDYIYVTAFTPDKVVNAAKYKVSGVGKIGPYSMISKESMNILVNSDSYFNTSIIYLSGKINEETVKNKEKEIKTILEKNGIKIEESRNYFKTMRENEAILLSFKALKIILLAVMFPLTGAILGALLWIHSFKRRKELWTYSAMGFKDSQIIKLLLTEYLCITLIGTLIGITGGAVSSVISERVNGMLSFTYIMNMLIKAKIGAGDIVFIVMFMLLNIIFWLRFPVNKIVKDKPFSY